MHSKWRPIIGPKSENNVSQIIEALEETGRLQSRPLIITLQSVHYFPLVLLRGSVVGSR
jgi:hypothetical protein